MRNKRRIIYLLASLAIVAALWALGIELRYERNVRRGIPADFYLHRAHRPLNWKV